MSKTYVLSKWNYGELILCQLTGVFAWVFIVPMVNSETGSVDLKQSTRIFMGVTLVLTSYLYFCPNPLISLGILTVSRILLQAVNTIVWINIAKLYPPKVRSSLTGLTTGLITMPQPILTFLTEWLSKKPHYYLTSLLMAIYSYGLIGAMLVPKEVLNFDL